MSSLTGIPSSQVLDLVDEGRYAEAKEALKDKLTRSPDSVSLRQQLADVLVLLGEHGQAIDVLERLADDYVKIGLSGKAIAVQKKIERIGEARVETEHGLAHRIRVREEELASRASYRLSVDEVPAPDVEDSGTRIAARPAPASPAPRPMLDPDACTEFIPMPAALMSALLPNTQQRARELSTEESLEPPEEVAPPREAVVGNPLFRDLPEGDLQALIAGMKLQTFDAGEIIVTEGEPGDSLFVLTTGRVKAFVRDATGHNHRVRQLPEGSFFGEVALLTGRPRTATIVAAMPCELLKLDRPTLDSFTTSHPGVLRVMQTFCAARLNSAAAALVRARGEKPTA